MRREIRQYVESELKYYKESREELGLIRYDIINPGSDSTKERIGSPSAGAVTKPTEDAVLQMISSRRLQHLEAVVGAIEKTLRQLDPCEREMVELLYWSDRYNPEGIAQKLHCNKRTVYRWRNQVCETIASEMGLI